MATDIPTTVRKRPSRIKPALRGAGVVLGVSAAVAALTIGVIVPLNRENAETRRLRQESHDRNVKSCQDVGGVVIVDDSLWFKSCVVPAAEVNK